MNLDAQTIPKLLKQQEKRKAELLTLRPQLLNFITVNSNFAVVVAPDSRHDAAKILNRIDVVSAEISQTESLISSVDAAAEALGMGENRDFPGRLNRFENAIATHQAVLRKGVLGETLSRAKCAELEKEIETAQKKLDEMSEVLAPILDGIQSIP